MTGYRVGLVGHGVHPSLTPPMHRREAEHLGLDYRYDVIDLLDEPDLRLDTLLKRLEEESYDAVNVTHPFKQDVLTHVDERSAAVDQVGSANLVLLGGGQRIAHNTDLTGFRSGLDHFLGDRPRGSVLQVGAGGAGLATACSLVAMDFADIVVHDRDPAAAEALVQRYPGRLRATGAVDLADEVLAGADGVVHVTPMGMKEHPGTAFAPEVLAVGSWIAEVVYRPLETELVSRARARGLDVLDGGLMAVGQAVDSIRLITGMEPDRERMLAHFHGLVGASTPGGAA
ncbi:shikimate dehydrogenase [Aeromicrobium sp. CF3.5]|uniref:shikimate dehydrogenase n=1 Tax=Aeromicrobium sp. CF3.5 TaxID=3373078 RepID=UPI003EE7FB29